MKHHPRFVVLNGALFAATVGVLLSVCAHAEAALVGYQSQAAFNTAISGWTQTSTNFESASAGTTYAAGTGPAGSGFTLMLSGPDAASQLPAVSDQFWTTSGTHYLGLDNPDTALEAGDSLTFTFGSPGQAFGLFIIGNRDILGGDISLSVGSSSVLNAATADMTDGFGSFAYFLGLVSDDAGTFNSATLAYSTLQPPSLLPISVDDVVFALNNGASPIPEPDTAALTLIGLMLLSVGLRPRSR